MSDHFYYDLFRLTLLYAPYNLVLNGKEAKCCLPHPTIVVVMSSYNVIIAEGRFAVDEYFAHTMIGIVQFFLLLYL